MKDIGRQILHTIKEHYPLGVQAETPEYDNSDETKRWKLRQEASRQPEVVARWENFTNSVVNANKGITEQLLHAKVWIPSYSVIFLKNFELVGTISHRQSIHVEVSVLGPYYTIYALEEVWIEGPEDNFVVFDPVVFISPYGPHKDEFRFVRSAFSAAYPEFSFVPHPVLRHRIQRLSLPNVTAKEGPTLYQALFNYEDIFDNRRCPGDSRYT